jgi:hypothetical protein
MFHENVEGIHEVFSGSPCRSIQIEARVVSATFESAVGITKMCTYVDKLQVMQAITLHNRIAHNQFPVTILEKLEKDNKFLQKTCSLIRLQPIFQGR